MFSKIPPNRLLAYILLLGSVFFVFVATYLYFEWSELELLEEDISQIGEQYALFERKQKNNQALRTHYSDADHFYIDKEVESLVFLKPEIEALQRIEQHKNYAGDEQIKRRLDFLTSGKNRLALSEGTVVTYPYFQETTETLVHPIEVNVSDLEILLEKIEGNVETRNIKGPQLLILDLKLDRKNLEEKNEVYLLQMKLLKREFNQ